ncbi:MAG: extensin family protein [Erythrobacter sp.]
MTRLVLLRTLALIACSTAITGCSFLPSGSSDRASNNSSQQVSSVPRDYSPRPADNACFADLSAAGNRFSPLPDRYPAQGCSQLGTVQLSALAGDRSQFGISNIGPVQCQTAQSFSEWARFGVDRAARQILGSPLERIETMGSYSCRNVAGSSRRSAHARAEAIDVSAFILKDGTRVSVQGDWSNGTTAEREFLRVVHGSACKRFGTVLGPNYNRAHEDHFHLEKKEGSFCR